MERLSNVFNIIAVKTSNRNSSVISHINRKFFTESLDFLGVKSGKGKHTHLVGDVIPITLGTRIDKVGLKLLSH